MVMTVSKHQRTDGFPPIGQGQPGGLGGVGSGASGGIRYFMSIISANVDVLELHS